MGTERTFPEVWHLSEQPALGPSLAQALVSAMQVPQCPAGRLRTPHPSHHRPLYAAPGQPAQLSAMAPFVQRKPRDAKVQVRDVQLLLPQVGQATQGLFGSASSSTAQVASQSTQLSTACQQGSAPPVACAQDATSWPDAAPGVCAVQACRPGPHNRLQGPSASTGGQIYHNQMTLEAVVEALLASQSGAGSGLVPASAGTTASRLAAGVGSSGCNYPAWTPQQAAACTTVPGTLPSTLQPAYQLAQRLPAARGPTAGCCSHAPASAAAVRCPYYAVRRLQSAANFMLMYLVDSGGNAALAVLGADTRFSGHFVYSLLLGLPGTRNSGSSQGRMPVQRCTNRTKALAWLACWGADQQVDLSLSEVQAQQEVCVCDQLLQGVPLDTPALYWPAAAHSETAHSDTAKHPSAGAAARRTCAAASPLSVGVHPHAPQEELAHSVSQSAALSPSSNSAAVAHVVALAPAAQQQQQQQQQQQEDHGSDPQTHSACACARALQVCAFQPAHAAGYQLYMATEHGPQLQDATPYSTMHTIAERTAASINACQPTPTSEPMLTAHSARKGSVCSEGSSVNSNTPNTELPGYAGSLPDHSSNCDCHKYGNYVHEQAVYVGNQYIASTSVAGPGVAPAPSIAASPQPKRRFLLGVVETYTACPAAASYNATMHAPVPGGGTWDMSTSAESMLPHKHQGLGQACVVRHSREVPLTAWTHTHEQNPASFAGQGILSSSQQADAYGNGVHQELKRQRFC